MVEALKDLIVGALQGGGGGGEGVSPKEERGLAACTSASMWRLGRKGVGSRQDIEGAVTSVLKGTSTPSDAKSRVFAKACVDRVWRECTSAPYWGWLKPF